MSYLDEPGQAANSYNNSLACWRVEDGEKEKGRRKEKKKGRKLRAISSEYIIGRQIHREREREGGGRKRRIE